MLFVVSFFISFVAIFLAAFIYNKRKFEDAFIAAIAFSITDFWYIAESMLFEADGSISCIWLGIVFVFVFGVAVLLTGKNGPINF